MISKRAIETLERRKTPVASYYINWNRWLPIMRAYEEGQAKYFATRGLSYFWVVGWYVGSCGVQDIDRA